MRSEEAYKAEVFARRDAVLRVRRRRRRAMLSLLPILCVAGISAAFFLLLPQNAPTKESADGTQKTEATRSAGQSGDTNGSVDDDTADGIADGDNECYKRMFTATGVTVADVPFSPQTVYWADDEKTVKAFAEQTEDTGLQAQLASYDAAFFKTHRLFIYYLPDSTVTGFLPTLTERFWRYCRSRCAMTRSAAACSCCRWSDGSWTAWRPSASQTRRRSPPPLSHRTRQTQNNTAAARPAAIPPRGVLFTT